MSDGEPMDGRDPAPADLGFAEKALAAARRGLIGALCGGAVSLVPVAYLDLFGIEVSAAKVLGLGAGLGLLLGAACGGMKLRGRLKGAAVGAAAGLFLGGFVFGVLLFPQTVRLFAPEAYRQSCGKPGGPVSFLAYRGVAIGGTLGVLLGTWIGARLGARARRPQ